MTLFRFPVAALLVAVTCLAQALPYERSTPLSLRLEEQWRLKQTEARQQISALDSAPMRRLLDRPGLALSHLDPSGIPIFLAVENLNAARTISTDDIRPGGSTGLSLTGAGIDFLGMWDSGVARSSHQEFEGRVTVHDSGNTSEHATHVAGTLIAAGIDASAQGMAYQAGLHDWDWDNDLSEMAAAASGGLRVSNHSYGLISGWYWSGTDWYWFGDINISPSEDYNFGFYGSKSRDHDVIANEYPNYLIVNSAGNDRADAGPGAGGIHYVWNGGWVQSTVTRPPDGGNGYYAGYDCIGTDKCAKNTLTIGAVDDIPAGYTRRNDVNMSSFSCWGPTDDGRIKPDVVANGVLLYSTIDSSDTGYSSLSGTSMASPSAAGSIALLSRHYESSLGEIPRAATIKGLVIHTADEAGTFEGPDYRYGWGLLNIRDAAELISLQTEENWHIRELQLQNGEEETFLLHIQPGGVVDITLSWTDPPGEVPAPALDPSGSVLVHDLDVQLTSPLGTVWRPWVLIPAGPTTAATRGDNTRDNVEQIRFTPYDGGEYTLRVSHKGTIAPQDYSLILSGVAPSVCTNPTPLAPQDLQIELVDEDVQLQWLPVNESVEGCPLTNCEYQVWKSSSPDSSTVLLATTNITNYTDVNGTLGEGLFTYHVIATCGGSGPEIVVISAGSFTMGQIGWATPEHQVTLTHDFELGRTEVTNAQYLEALNWAQAQGLISVVGDYVQQYGVNLLRINQTGYDRHEIRYNQATQQFYLHAGTYRYNADGPGQAYLYGYNPANHPVTNVSWYGAACYCDWLSMMQGLPAYYNGNWTQIPFPNSPYLAVGYRLPQSPEWEYAAQYNDERTYPWGNDASNYCQLSNSNNCTAWTAPVGSRPGGASNLGLLDLLGNVSEWCNDWAASWSNEASIDPLGPYSDDTRVMKGCHHDRSLLPVASIRDSNPYGTEHYNGFRLCRTLF